METGKLRCLVVDDESIARKGMVRHLKKFKTLEVVGEANSVDSFMEVNERLKPDLIFLDIMLRNKNVMDYLSNSIEMPMIVFVTAYSHFAHIGFDLKAVDYLMKPVSEERMNQCLQRVQDVFSGAKPNPLNTHESLYLKSNGKFYRTKAEDILYVKSMENYVLIFTEQHKLICKLTMEQIKEMLPQQCFLQVHRSFLVNTQKIDIIDKLTIHIKNESIPISREKRKDIYQFLM